MKVEKIEEFTGPLNKKFFLELSHTISSFPPSNENYQTRIVNVGNFSFVGDKLIVYYSGNLLIKHNSIKQRISHWKIELHSAVRSMNIKIFGFRYRQEFEIMNFNLADYVIFRNTRKYTRSLLAARLKKKIENKKD